MAFIMFTHRQNHVHLSVGACSLIGIIMRVYRREHVHLSAKESGGFIGVVFSGDDIEINQIVRV